LEVAHLPKQTFFNLPDHKRERVIRFAVSEFAQHGYKQASISRIVAAADIAKGSFYQYFEDKDDLFIHIVASEIGSVKRDIYTQELGRLTEVNLSQFLRYVAKAQIHALRLQPELFSISLDLMRMPPGEPIFEKLMQYAESERDTVFLSIIQCEIDRGKIDRRVNPKLLNYMLMGMTQYLTHMFSSDKVENISDKVIDEVIDQMTDDLDYILTSGIYTKGS